MSLLTTIQRAAVLAGVPRPALAAAASDGTTAQMVELARLDAEELAGRADWSALVRQQAFVTVAGSAQPGGLPTDYGRMTFNGAIRQDFRAGALQGPTANVDWDRISAFPQGVSAPRWRIFGGQLQILPAPPVGQSVRFPYVSKNLYADANGVTKAAWDADTDVCLIPESAIALGVVWRWRQLKGLEYAEALRSAEMEIERAMGRDRGGRASLSPSRRRSGNPAFPGPVGSMGPDGSNTGSFTADRE